MMNGMEMNNVNNMLDYEKIIKSSTTKILELQGAILNVIAEMVECRDDVTGGHIERTQKYLGILIGAMIQEGVYAEEVDTWDLGIVLHSAQLHDVGKIAIRDSVLLKSSKLTPEEFEHIKEHTIIGENVIDKIQKNTSDHAFLEYAKILAGSHHEKWNGSGYPRGLKETQIPLLGRVMAIADVYDALISERPYKKAFTHQVAADIIKNDSGIHFDPVLVDVFIRFSDDFHKISKG